MTINPLSSTTPTQQLTRPQGPPPGGGPEKTNKAVADLLGMDSDALKTALDSGQTMSDLAAAAGVSQADLLATVKATLPTTGPDGVSADTMAANIVSGTQPTHRPHQHKADADLGAGLDQLSSSLGISSADLMTRLTDGTGISDLLQANPAVSASLAGQDNKGALIDGWS